MTLLVLGVLLWSVVHLFPVLARPQRDRLAARLGEGPYKGVFSLAILGSIALMVFGWRITVPEALWDPPVWAGHVTVLLVFIAIALFGAAGGKSVIKRWIRHPMLTGVVVWAGAHLLVNGDSRSLFLFGGLGLWALVAIPAINRRDGPRALPDRPPLSSEIKLLVISAVVYAALLFGHPYFTGVDPLDLFR